METLGNALREKDPLLVQTVLLEQLHRGSLDLQTLFIVLAYVRDIDGGMGERKLTYAMLDVWYERFPVLAVYALEALILCGYGSWRDVPGLCNYIKEVRRENHPLIETAVDFMLRHVDADDGLAAKWVPRETSKKNLWLFDLFVSRWYNSSKCCTQEKRRQFRRMISEKTRKAPAPALTSTWLSPRYNGGDGRALSSWIHSGQDAEWTRFARNKYYPCCLEEEEQQEHRDILCVLPPLSSSKDGVLVETLLLLEKMQNQNQNGQQQDVDVVLTTDPLSRVTIRVSDGFSHNVDKLLAAVDGQAVEPSFDAVYEALARRAPAGQQPYFMLVVGGQRPSLYAVAAHPRYDPMRVLFDRIVF